MAFSIDARPHLLLTAEPAPGLRTLEALRRDIAEDKRAAQLWEHLRSEADEALAHEPYVPTSLCPGRALHHAATGNRDFIIVDAVCRRLKNDALVWLLTHEQRYLDDAMQQFETLFDAAKWPDWLDLAHKGPNRVADLRTGMLLRAIGYAYDWLHGGLSNATRRWLIEQLDRRAIQPYLQEVQRGAWFTGTERMNNWNTVIVGGAGTAAMALGNAHPDSPRILAHALHVMNAYLKHLGQEGEFDESVGYAGAMHCPVDFFATHRYHTRGEADRLSDPVFTDFCHWYMHFIVPPGRSVRFGDCAADTAPKAAIFPPIAAATRDGVLQWFYLHHTQPNLRSDWAMELLFYDPTVEPVSPEGKLPRGRAFYDHGATWSSRTDWNPDTTACIVYGKAGHGNECHGHHDAGQVCIDAYGKELIVDLGHPAPSYPEDFFTAARWRYYHAGVVGHNVLMFDGREMRSSRDGRDETLEAHFNDHHGGHWAQARVLAAQFDDDTGGYWQGDMTPLYDVALTVRRTLVHLYPTTVVVLDEAVLERDAEVSLRWHTVDRCEPSADGRFTVHNEGVHLASQVVRLDGNLNIHRNEHAHHPPYDTARLGHPLQQRHESYIEATCRTASCRLLSLFAAFPEGASPQAWEPSAEGWQIATVEGAVAVSVTATSLFVQHHTTGRSWNVPLGLGIGPCFSANA